MIIIRAHDLRTLISKGETDRVLNYLERFANKINSNPLLNLLAIISGRFENNKKETSQGVVNGSDSNLVINQVNVGLIDIISDLEKTHKENFWIDSEDADDGNVEEGTSENILAELAKEMAFNHFTVSFGESQKKFEDQRAREIFNKIRKFDDEYIDRPERRRRNILLIGAGATHQACPYIPFGVRLKDFLESSPVKEHREIVEESKIEKRRGFIYNDRFNPEHYLGLVHDNIKEENRYALRGFLHEVYNRRYMPTHAYEIIAHLFKHSFISVIINFNFDEFLDEAIEEEMGKQKYIKVLHDGDCVDFEKIFIDGRLKTPVYIKIHGTASQKSSLKFSDNHNFYLSQDMKAFIDKWIEGRIVNPRNPEDERIPVNIISLGFDMDRFAFRDQISAAKPRPGSKWFQINWDKPMMPITYEIDGRKYELKSRHIKLKDWERLNTDLPPLADLLTRLYDDHISKVFNDKFPPRGISRHQIVANMFYSSIEHGQHEDYGDPETTRKIYQRLEKYFRSPRYFFERTVIEVALGIIKNKGIVEPRESSREKIGYFYKKYKEQFVAMQDAARRRNERIEQQAGLKPYEKELFSLNKIYDIFDLTHTYSFSNNLLNLSPFDKENDDWIDSDRLIILAPLSGKKSNDNDLIQPEDLNKPENLPILVFYRILKRMNHMEVLENLKSLQESGKIKFDWNQAILLHAQNIYKGYTYDIKPVFGDESLLHFTSVKREHTLHTNLSLTYHFSEFLKRHNEWDICLFISERGKLFSSNYFTNSDLLDEKGNYLGSFSDKLIVSISCQEAVAKALNINTKIITKEDVSSVIDIAKKSFGYTGIKMQYCLLPYWRHHHHMILFLKTSKCAPIKENVSYIQLGEGKYLHLLRSIYYFKQGFSNTINPVLFPVEGRNDLEMAFIRQDQEFLLSTLLAHYLKAIVYQNTGNFVPVINPDLSFDFRIKEENNADPNYAIVNVSYLDFLNALYLRNLSGLIPKNTAW